MRQVWPACRAGWSTPWTPPCVLLRARLARYTADTPRTRCSSLWWRTRSRPWSSFRRTYTSSGSWWSSEGGTFAHEDQIMRIFPFPFTSFGRSPNPGRLTQVSCLRGFGIWTHELPIDSLTHSATPALSMCCVLKRTRSVFSSLYLILTLIKNSWRMTAVGSL